MHTFTSHQLTLTLVAGVALGVAVAAAQVGDARLAQARKDADALATSESQVNALNQQLTQWKVAQTALGGPGARGFRKEPVSLSAVLPPERLYTLTPILAKVYDNQGYFSVKHFSFAWQEPAAQNGEEATAERVAKLSLTGERTLILDVKSPGVTP